MVCEITLNTYGSNYDFRIDWDWIDAWVREERREATVRKIEVGSIQKKGGDNAHPRAGSLLGFWQKHPSLPFFHPWTGFALFNCPKVGLVLPHVKTVRDVFVKRACLRDVFVKIPSLWSRIESMHIYICIAYKLDLNKYLNIVYFPIIVLCSHKK